MRTETMLLFRSFALITLLIAAGDCLLAAEPASVASADAAFDRGNHDEALALYDQVLKDDPDNLQALVRSGMLLSWQSKYVAAIERYDRALAVNPNNYKAQIERAKVLSWSKQFEKAQEAFIAIADSNPDDRDARLGLARSYSWGGDQVRARAEYMKLVDRNGSDIDGLIGVGQTYAWTGNSTEALIWYEKALAVEPGKLGALMGRAYIDLWSGDRGRAVAALEELEKKYPGNSDVAELRRSVDRAMSFWFRTTWDTTEDTDDNQIYTTRIEVGDVIAPKVEYRVGIVRSDMTSPEGDALIDRAGGAIAYLPGGGHRIEFRLGSDRTEDTLGETESEVVGGAVWSFGISRKTSGFISLARETMIYSPKIANNHIGYDTLASALTHRFTPTVSLEVRGSMWSLTDDNERVAYDGTVRWTPKTREVTWLLGAGYRNFSYDENFDNGYFDPQDYATYFALLGARGRFGSTSATWDLSTEVGMQSFTLGGIETEDDQTLSGTLTLGFPMGRWAVMEVWAGHSDSAMQTATGFESDSYGVRLRIQRR